MLAIRVVLLLFLTLSGSQAWSGMPWHSCQGELPPQQQINTKDSLKLIRAAFLARFDLSQSEFNHIHHCLKNEVDQTESCIAKRDYFLNALPYALKKYRQTLAMSRMSSYAVLGHGDAKAFNEKLQAPHMFWPIQEKIDPLTPEESQEVAKLWDRRIKMIAERMVKHIQEYNQRLKERYIAPTSASRTAIVLLSQENLEVGQLLRHQHISWIGQFFNHIRRMIFRLNQKRIIEEVGRHPLLAFIKKPHLDKVELMRALQAMQRNQSEQRLAILGRLDRTISQVSYADRRIHPYFDYIMIMEDILSENPQYCEDFGQVYRKHVRAQIALTGLSIVALGAVAIFAPPVIGMAVFGAHQGFLLYHAKVEADRTASQSTMNPQGGMGANPGLNIVPFQEAYMKSDDFGTEVIISPLVVTTAPLLRFTKTLGFARGVK